MPRPYDAYVEQQKRKAEDLEASIRADERARIISLLKEQFGEEYYELGICGRIVALIRDENIAPEIPQFKGTRAQIDALTIKGEG